MIYTDCENTLVPKNNGKQNLDESYTNKYQKHVACSYGYKLVSVDDKFSKSLKSSPSVKMKSMIKESKYCSDVMKKDFNKEIVITKKGDEDFEKTTKC